MDTETKNLRNEVRSAQVDLDISEQEAKKHNKMIWLMFVVMSAGLIWFSLSQ